MTLNVNKKSKGKQENTHAKHGDRKEAEFVGVKGTRLK